MKKDENNGQIMTHFIGLRSKMHATKLYYTPEEIEKERIKLEKNDIKREQIMACFKNKGVTKKIKGVKKSVIKNNITFEDYVDCLETFNEKIISQNLIRANKYELYTLKQSKIGLSALDDKRRVTKTSVCTLPFGHCSIMEE